MHVKQLFFKPEYFWGHQRLVLCHRLHCLPLVNMQYSSTIETHRGSNSKIFFHRWRSQLKRRQQRWWLLEVSFLEDYFLKLSLRRWILYRKSIRKCSQWNTDLYHEKITNGWIIASVNCFVSLWSHSVYNITFII